MEKHTRKGKRQHAWLLDGRCANGWHQCRNLHIPNAKYDETFFVTEHGRDNIQSMWVTKDMAKSR